MIERRGSRDRIGRLGATLALGGLLALSVAGCTGDISARGNEPTAERLSQIEPGRQSRAEVAALLGTPSTTAMFDDETWYYISAQTHQSGLSEREELKRRVIAIAFGPDGRVSDVQELGLDDGHDVDVVSRETPTLGNELSVVEQFLGNLGRFQGSGGNGLETEIPGL
ncbi:outer membrane protein assembly factor BamE [Roseospira marina]|uniref:outer membrane protein assembly factor BamE n=1 Tax=Roseospira marina TaxID=140057 RepID=UPI0017DED12C|nr:outer membrane protein assembly factor BamE [Roseospira marina]MBB4312297.1 outer membrane protein assembly factor BamE (lipoprotein component of BamABCDE complex) [Roseospira marina]MBB5085687.1 outer membrane protein assembly factor BamE (lipoprotein component of BamABCDE complex) [Roseospira marina]